MILGTILACLVATAMAYVSPPYGDIKTCDVHVVKPGDDFQIPCHTERGIQASMFPPGVTVPDHEALVAENIKEMANRETPAKETETLIKYTDATKGIDDGYYTCVIFHGTDYIKPYSKDRCLVTIEDVCEGSCSELENCHAEYPAGTFECNCDFGCQMKFSPQCSDRCEQFLNPCYMKVQSCQDGKDRGVLKEGLCGFKKSYNPEIRRFSNEVIADEGAVITMTSGLVEEAIQVAAEWTFLSEAGETKTLDHGTGNWELTVGIDTIGVYTVTLTTCRDPDRVVVNKVSVGLSEGPSEGPDKFKTLYHTCSIYPGGGIGQFDGGAASYDLACSHVLAANVAPESGLPWYIYGTFDNYDGSEALASMTFYLGESIFEIQRGWIVNIDGDKMKLTEGVEPANIPGDSGCTVQFQFRHLIIRCDGFNAYYDGIMAGHITLTAVSEGEAYVKKPWNIGLCNDGNSGFRPNWQIGSAVGDCSVDPGEPMCDDDPTADCVALTMEEPALAEIAWTRCGEGATLGCNVISCDGGTPTSAQWCSLKQASQISCALKTSDKNTLENEEMDIACPEVCEWKNKVLDSGCPQEYPPFQDCTIGS